jgi:hypothetical protein
LVNGIAENGKGKAEYALDANETTDKVIYLLECSIKESVKDFDITFEDSTINSELKSKSTRQIDRMNYLIYDEDIELYSSFKTDNFNSDVLTFECSFILPEWYTAGPVIFKHQLNASDIQVNDYLHKLWAYEFTTQKSGLAAKGEIKYLTLKYKILNNYSALYCVVKDNSSEAIQRNKNCKEIIECFRDSHCEKRSHGAYMPKCLNLIMKESIEPEFYKGSMKGGGGILSGVKKIFSSVASIFNKSEKKEKSRSLKMELCESDKQSAKLSSYLDEPNMAMAKNKSCNIEIDEDLPDFDMAEYLPNLVVNKTSKTTYTIDILIEKQKVNGLWKFNDDILIFFNIANWSDIELTIKNTFNDVDVEILFSLLIIYLLDKKFPERLNNMRLMIKKCNEVIENYLQSKNLDKMRIIDIYDSMIK